MSNISNSSFQSNSSYYIYFESDKFDIDYWIDDGKDKTALKSPKIDGNSKSCLGFWYVF